jgi:hypothetical protein
MPSATAKGFPYPVGAVDAIADSDLAIQALAEFLDANNGRFKWGQGTIDIVTVNVAVSLAVLVPAAYPVGVTPAVFAWSRGGSGTGARFVQVSSEANTGFTVIGLNTANNSDITFGWVALG